MTPEAREIACALLLATTLGCAHRDGGPVPSPVEPPEKFRLVLTRAERDNTRPEDTWAAFHGRIEMADGSPFPEGRWYFESPRMAEDVLLPDDRRLPHGDLIGPPPGFGTAVVFLFGGIRADETKVLRMAIDIPALEILEGDDETLRLDTGTEVDRRFGPLSVRIIGQESEVSVFLGDQGETIPPVPFYSGGARPQEHAWWMTDARGRPVNQSGGMGFGTFSHETYGTSPALHGSVAFPVTLHWRIPRKWRVTLQRFILENVRLEPVTHVPPDGGDEGERKSPPGMNEE